MPPLNSPVGRDFIDCVIEELVGVDLVVFDNISNTQEEVCRPIPLIERRPISLQQTFYRSRAQSRVPD
jgi:hypothetical protein